MNRRRPNILFLSQCWPAAQSYGAQIRALNTARALRRVGQVTVAVVNTDPFNGKIARNSSREFEIEPYFHAQPSPGRGVCQQIRWALDTRYLDLHGCRISDADRERMRSCLLRYDLVWLMNSRTANLMRLWRWPHAHLDVDDLPSEYFRTASRCASGPVERGKARVMRILSRRRELRFKERFTTLSVCSENDRRLLGADERIHVIPNGFERPKAEPVATPSQDPPRIGFIGLYSYPPNLNGVSWFLRESWPIVRKAVPGVRFRLIGRDTAGPLKPVEPDVDALGWVEDSAAEIATWSAMVIPVRIGAGTRLKVADAFSKKCPVVSTRHGAFGYDVEDARQLRLADTPRDFANACIELIRDPVRAAAMAARAWNDYLEKWTWDAIAPKVWNAAEDCLRRSADGVG